MTTYKILGKSVQPHSLAIATILSCAAGVTLLTRTGKKGKTPPPSQCQVLATTGKGDIDSEKFIEDFLKEYDTKGKD